MPLPSASKATALTQVFVVATLLPACMGPVAKHLQTPITQRTPEGFQQFQEHYEKKTVEYYVKKNGTPDSTFDLGNGKTVWTYLWDRSYKTPEHTITETEQGTSTTSYDRYSDTINTTHNPGTAITKTFGGDLVKIYCKVDLHIQNGKIQQIQGHGNDCRLKPKLRPLDCTRVGQATRIESVGRAEKDGENGDAVRLMNGQVFVFDEDVGIENVIYGLPAGTKVITCRQSKKGAYLLTYPPPNSNIYLGSFR